LRIGTNSTQSPITAQQVHAAVAAKQVRDVSLSALRRPADAER